MGVLNISLNLFFIPRFGVFGAAASLLLSEFFMWLGFRLIALHISPAVENLRKDLIRLLIVFCLLWIMLVFPFHGYFVRFALLGLVWLLYGVFFVNAYRRGGLG